MNISCSGHTLLTDILPKFPLKFINSTLWITHNYYSSISSTFISLEQVISRFHMFSMHFDQEMCTLSQSETNWQVLDPSSDVIVTSQWRRDVTLSNQAFATFVKFTHFRPSSLSLLRVTMSSCNTWFWSIYPLNNR